MTEEFAKTVNRLARARNFEGGTYLLITKQHDEDDIDITAKGNEMINMLGIVGYIRSFMQESTTEKRQEVLDILKKVIIREEERLFQEKEIEV